VIRKKQDKWYKRKLNRETGKAAVPRENGKNEERCGKCCRECVLPQAFFQGGIER